MQFHDAKKGTRIRLTKSVLYSWDDDGKEIRIEAGATGTIKNQFIDDDSFITVTMDDGKFISIIEHELGDVEAESGPQTVVGT